MSQICNKQFDSLCVFLDLFVYFFVKGIFKKKNNNTATFSLLLWNTALCFQAEKQKNFQKVAWSHFSNVEIKRKPTNMKKKRCIR